MTIDLVKDLVKDYEVIKEMSLNKFREYFQAQDILILVEELYKQGYTIPWKDSILLPTIANLRDHQYYPCFIDQLVYKGFIQKKAIKPQYLIGVVDGKETIVGSGIINIGLTDIQGRAISGGIVAQITSDGKLKIISGINTPECEEVLQLDINNRMKTEKM